MYISAEELLILDDDKLLKDIYPKVFKKEFMELRKQTIVRDGLHLIVGHSKHILLGEGAVTPVVSSTLLGINSHDQTTDIQIFSGKTLLAIIRVIDFLQSEERMLLKLTSVVGGYGEESYIAIEDLLGELKHKVEISPAFSLVVPDISKLSVEAKCYLEQTKIRN